MNHCSEQLNELGAALAKAQAEFGIAGRTSDNPFFKSKYADLAEIVRVSRPALCKNGLSFMQIPAIECDNMILISRLQHTSGQWVESRWPIRPIKNDIQSLGSYISYVKRYALAALIGVVAGDEDDDGEAAVRDAKSIPQPMRVEEYITPEQLETIEYELLHRDDIVKQVLEGLNINKLRDMPKSKFMASLQRIREIKQTK